MPKEKSTNINASQIQQIIDTFDKNHQLETNDLALAKILMTFNQQYPAYPQTAANIKLCFALGSKTIEYFFTRTRHLLEQQPRDIQHCWLSLHTANKYILILEQILLTTGDDTLKQAFQIKLQAQCQTFQQIQTQLVDEISLFIAGAENSLRSKDYLNSLAPLEQLQLAECFLWYGVLKNSKFHFKVARVICRGLIRRRDDQLSAEAFLLNMFATAKTLKIQTSKTDNNYNALLLFSELKNNLPILNRMPLPPLCKYNAYYYQIHHLFESAKIHVEEAENSKNDENRKRQSLSNAPTSPSKRNKISPPQSPKSPTLRT